MSKYFKDFIRYNRTNEVGKVLVILSLCVNVLFAIPTVFAVLAGESVTPGIWMTFPILFTATAVAHLIARPLIARHYR